MGDSQQSTASTIPYELISNYDPDFIDELENVNLLYFGHEEIVDENRESDSSSYSDSDSDSDTLSNDFCDILPAHASEESKQKHFQKNGCGCVRLYGKPCSQVLSWEELKDYRLSCLERTKSEIDFMVKVQLFHHRQNSELTDSCKHKAKERERVRQNYFFGGKKVCREVFVFAHGLNRKTVDAIAKSIDQNSLEPRIHGNKNRVPKHALTLSDVNKIKLFLTTYASNNGLPLPGRLPKFRNEKYILLPSDKNKADIHSLYCESADSLDYRKVSLSEFKKIWLEQCPYLLVMKPATDLCVKCQKHVHEISHCGNLTEEEKAEKLEKYQKHLDHVKCQRDHYREQCLTTKQVFDELPAQEKIRGTVINTG